MKKKPKKKAVKSSSRKATVSAPDQELPTLVTAMTKLVERLEALEWKMDQVLARVSNLPAEIRNHGQKPQQFYPPQSAPRPEQKPANPQGAPEVRRERPMHQAVCADCRKNCEVPFKPTEERPVYCKACFALRKAGHNLQGSSNRGVLNPQKSSGSVPLTLSSKPQGSSAPSGNSVDTKLSGKQKPFRNDSVKAKKRK